MHLTETKESVVKISARKVRQMIEDELQDLNGSVPKGEVTLYVHGRAVDDGEAFVLKYVDSEAFDFDISAT